MKTGCCCSVSLKHLLIWILVLNIHYWLLSSCWLLVVGAQVPSYCSLHCKTLIVHEKARLFRTVSLQVCGDKDNHQWMLSHELPAGPANSERDCWMAVFREMEVLQRMTFLSLKLFLKPRGLYPKRKKVSFGVKIETDMVRVTSNPKMASPGRQHDQTTLGKGLREVVTILAEMSAAGHCSFGFDLYLLAWDTGFKWTLFFFFALV